MSANAHAYTRRSSGRPSSPCTTYNPEKASAIYGVRSAARRELMRTMAAAVQAGSAVYTWPSASPKSSGDGGCGGADDEGGGHAAADAPPVSNGVLSRSPVGPQVATPKGMRQQQWVQLRELHSTVTGLQQVQPRPRLAAAVGVSRGRLRRACGGEVGGGTCEEVGSGAGVGHEGAGGISSRAGGGGSARPFAASKGLGGWAGAAPRGAERATGRPASAPATPAASWVVPEATVLAACELSAAGAAAARPVKAALPQSASAPAPPASSPPSPPAAPVVAAAAAATAAVPPQQSAPPAGLRERNPVPGNGGHPSCARPASGSSRPTSARPTSARPGSAHGGGEGAGPSSRAGALGDGNDRAAEALAACAGAPAGVAGRGEEAVMAGVPQLTVGAGSSRGAMLQRDWDFKCERQELGIVDEDSEEGDSDGSGGL